MTIHSDPAVALPKQPYPASKSLNDDGVNLSEDHTLQNGGTYTVKDQWHSQAKRIRVIHVGAGAAGLLMAYKMKKDFEDYDLVCYEKFVATCLHEKQY
jgi:hypothetical protein